MKSLSKNIILIICSLFVLTIPISAQEKIPVLNKKIVSYVKSVIGIQVDRGECWDLANEALTKNNARWDGEYKYGELLDLKKDEVFPGDIIQFKNVKVTYTVGNAIYKETMAHHTAIVYRVISKGKYELAHQNTGFSGRKVGLSTLDLSTVIKGKMYFYRPVSN
jgi:hypothetical protein